MLDIEHGSETWSQLSSRLTDERREKMLRIARERTRYLRLVLQDIHHPHNVSACLRSAEAFGISDVDIVTLQESFRPSSVSRGVTKWLDIHPHAAVESCAANLREHGYTLAAAYPSPSATPLDMLPLDKPIALIFGNEHGGVHESWRPHIDIEYTIPMVGIVESLNISVSCAVSLYSLRQRLLDESVDFLLNDSEQDELLSRWVTQHFAK